MSPVVSSLPVPEPLAWLEREARALGGIALGVTDAGVVADQGGFAAWLAAGWHGGMDYMARNLHLRHHPEELLPGTKRVISIAFPYLPLAAADAQLVLATPEKAYVSRYALARDYHKVIRSRLQTLAEAIGQKLGAHHYRVFTDSAPLREVALAVNAGLGWRGKNTLLLSRQTGSLCFLGDILTDKELPVSTPLAAHCGRCSRCLTACPTQALVAPYHLDARRCISYLTIEHQGSIPLDLRPLIGNHIYGCDDCQWVCPWNRKAPTTQVVDWQTPRHRLDNSNLVELFYWNETTFLRKMEGSAIRRIGHVRWLRNIAVALGNALRKTGNPEIAAALNARADHHSELVREHVRWGLNE